ncbi:MAG: hypothetical protein RL885_07835 [Planctomycetota bacterium]
MPRSDEAGAGESLGQGIEYERQFARAFLDPRRRGRFLELVKARDGSSRATPKGRNRLRQYCSMLADLEHWLLDEVKQSALYTSALETDEIRDRLVRLGSPEECQVLSISASLDNQRLSLEEALSRLSDGDNESTMLICCPDSLAFYWHGEIAGVSAILRSGRAR